MALSADRNGKLAQKILDEQDYPVAANAVIYLGGLYSLDANGYLAVVADSAAQANKHIVMALAAVNNTGGANGAVKVRCMTRGIALLPTGSLVQADLGKTIHATSDNVLALTSTNGRSVGRMVEFGAALCAVTIG